MNLEIETLSSIGRDSIGMKAQHWSHHPYRDDISYLAWISFSKCDLIPCDATNEMQCQCKARIKHGCILYDKHMHCTNLNLSCQVWTLGKLLHDEPFFMPWAKQRPPAHARPTFITILTRLDKCPICMHFSIWQGILHDVCRILYIKLIP